MYLREAESRLMKSIQRNSFTEEYRRPLSGESVIYKVQLILFLNDDFVICCRGHFLLLWYQIYLQNRSLQNRRLVIQVSILSDHCMCKSQGAPKIRYTFACLPVPPKGYSFGAYKGIVSHSFFTSL